MQFNKLNHISIVVDDIEKANHFYHDLLELHYLPRPNFDVRGSWFEFANGLMLHLIELESVNPQPWQHFALSVDDIEASKAWLEQKGITVSEIVPLPDNSARQCFFHDPSNNMIEIIQSQP